MPSLPHIYATVGESLAQSNDDLAMLETEVRSRAGRLDGLRGARERVATAGMTVDLQYGSPRGPALFAAPADLALVWIDREIATAKGELRKSLMALRDYAVKQLDGL